MWPYWRRPAGSFVTLLFLLQLLVLLGGVTRDAAGWLGSHWKGLDRTAAVCVAWRYFTGER